MDQELRAFLQEQFHEIRQRVEKVEAQIGGLREESQEGNCRSLFLLEEIWSHICLLGKGMASVDERMGRLEHEVKQKLQELWDMVVNQVRDLHHRVAHLEEVENRRARDIVEVIRERFGIQRDA